MRTVFSNCLLACLVGALVLLVPVASPAGNEVTVGALRQWAPEYATDASGRPTGFAIDLMDAVADEAGLTIRYVEFQDFPAMVAALQRGEIDVIPNYGITASRRRDVLFTRPVETFDIALLVRQESVGVAGLHDLVGHRVAVVHSNAGEALLAPDDGVRVVVYDDVRSAFYDLLAGHVDGLVYPQPVVLSLAQRAGLGDRVRVAGPPLAEIRRAIAVRPNETALRDRLDQALGALIASGEYEHIYGRWYAHRSWWTARRVAFVASLALLLLLVGTLVWRFTIQRRLLLEATGRLSAEAAQRRAEAALRAREEQLRQAQKMEAIGRLAGGVAHDFNNLLTVILANAERLGGAEREVGPAREIADAASRAADLTGQLLAFSRRQVLHPVILDPAEVVCELERLLRRLIGADIALRVDAPEECGAVRVDRSQLEQVLMNLVVNARDAMPEGGVLLIRVSAEMLGSRRAEELGAERGEHVVIEVTDTGEGMSPETLEHVFEPFFTTKGAGGGTGLGLATVHGIVQQSGGWMDVHSTPGAGTTFRIGLPRVDSPVVRAEVPRPVVLQAGHGMVLVVEDEPAVRRLVVQTLRGAGYHVIAAADGYEALELVAGRSPDLVVTDVVMPGLAGPVLTRRLAEQGCDAPVLYVSGYSDEPLARELDRPDRAFLGKPFTPSTLLHALQELGCVERPQRDTGT